MRALLLAIVVIGCSPSYELPPLASKDSGLAVVDASPAYPPQPWGGLKGSVVPDLSFQGYRAGSDVVEPLSLHDYYDPDGTKGITALVIESAVVWCPTCQNAARYFPPQYTKKYQPLGVRVLHLLREDLHTDPATMKDVDLWRTRYSFPFDNGLDDKQLSLALVPVDERVTPFWFVIDTRTMKIERTIAGAWGDWSYVPGLDAVVARNSPS